MAKKANDVGVEMSGATVRAAGTLNERIRDKGKPRADRVRHIAQIDVLGTKLVMSGVQPTQAYGHVSMGASVSQQVEMRKNLTWNAVRGHGHMHDNFVGLEIRAQL